MKCAVFDTAAPEDVRDARSLEPDTRAPQDGVRNGYDCRQLSLVRELCQVPLIASGGAGNMDHFAEVFLQADVDGALAASVFHKNLFSIGELKKALQSQNIDIRL